MNPPGPEEDAGVAIDRWLQVEYTGSRVTYRRYLRRCFQLNEHNRKVRELTPGESDVFLATSASGSTSTVATYRRILANFWRWVQPSSVDFSAILSAYVADKCSCDESTRNAWKADAADLCAAVRTALRLPDGGVYVVFTDDLCTRVASALRPKVGAWRADKLVHMLRAVWAWAAGAIQGVAAPPPAPRATTLDPLSVVDAWALSFNVGTALVHLYNAGDGGGVPELKAARMHLDREIARLSHDRA